MLADSRLDLISSPIHFDPGGMGLISPSVKSGKYRITSSLSEEKVTDRLYLTDMNTTGKGFYEFFGSQTCSLKRRNPAAFLDVFGCFLDRVMCFWVYFFHGLKRARDMTPSKKFAGSKRTFPSGGPMS